MRIVVLGANGRIGGYLYADPTSCGQVGVALGKVRPDTIVSLAVQNNIDECEVCPQSAYVTR
jgi:dTDP-4-dehydrorhamnose reductase